ncbi:hypothetical protein BDV93DRAFT_559075 [Ceratobasidium sp. AG-I]|nr:hypothetical protein BDV93DRAFT_559075 [Ceratobasidium sp. AG-I]
MSVSRGILVIYLSEAQWDWIMLHVTNLVNESSEALASGTSPSYVVNDQTVKTLRNYSVRWLLKGYNAINNPRLIKKAFELCAVPETEFNLSYESLTSREARQALSGLRSTDPEFYQEIMSGRSEVPSGKEEDEESDFENDEIDADCTVPELIEQVLSTAKLDELPGSSRNVDEQSDGYESEEYGYSAPVYLAAPCS